tara:strand:- start:1469 stop:1699 length:231 start_codon:yes stop_codon:yes gene_type:complete
MNVKDNIVQIEAIYLISPENELDAILKYGLFFRQTIEKHREEGKEVTADVLIWCLGEKLGYDPRRATTNPRKGEEK